MQTELFIGLMSGTSLDSIDAALVDLSTQHPTLLNTHYYAIPQPLRKALLSLSTPGHNEIDRLGELDIQMGQLFAKTALALLNKTPYTPQHIRAIGSHGHTIRHRPHTQIPFTLQIGDPNTIASQTNICTVADFRRRDISVGGQGAPLVPAFHRAIFYQKNTPRCIVNIGGIANITCLTNTNTFGFDTGPGNTLMDAWIQHHQNKPFDQNGDWARSGTVCPTLLQALCDDPYFKKSPPKSTGRETFHLDWLQTFSPEQYAPADVQATLCALTAHTLTSSIQRYFPSGEILIGGGGVHNAHLMAFIRQQLPHYPLNSTHYLNINPDAIEAMAFAWLAQKTLNNEANNCPAATGALQATCLGGIYLPYPNI